MKDMLFIDDFIPIEVIQWGYYILEDVETNYQIPFETIYNTKY